MLLVNVKDLGVTGVKVRSVLIPLDVQVSLMEWCSLEIITCHGGLIGFRHICLLCPQLTCSTLCELPEAVLCVCVCMDVDVIAHITVLERHALTFAQEQTNKYCGVHARTQGAWQRGEGGRMQGLTVPECVFEKEREKNLWCFLQNTIPIWDWLCNGQME